MGVKCESLSFQNVEDGHKKILLDGQNLPYLPKQLFSRLISSSLTLLDISNNKLSELPTEIGTLINLRYLYACGNQLTNIISSIGYLAELIILDFSRNAITSISGEIRFLKKLVHLNLSGNCIRYLPSSVVSLPSLKKLFLLRNPALENIPKDVALDGLEAIRAFLNIQRGALVAVNCEQIHGKPELFDSTVADFTKCIIPKESIFSGLVELFAEQMNLINDFRYNILSRKMKMNDISNIQNVDRMPAHGNEEFNNCSDCGRRKHIFRQFSSTSEYGSLTITGYGDTHEYVIPDVDSCNGNDGSCISDLDLQNETFSSIETDGSLEEEIALWDAEYHSYMDVFQDLVLVNKGVKITIPKYNMSGYSLTVFNIDVIHDMKYKPVLDSWSVLASEVVHFGPHGTKFFGDMPAIVKLPISVAIEAEDIIECYTSDTDLAECTKWQKFLPNNLCIAGQYVQFEVTHFSLFTVVIRKSRPKIVKMVESCGGAVILSDQDCNVVVDFPPNALRENSINASIELLYYDTFYVSKDLFESNMHALAAPIISVGPDGCQFDDDVSITVPLPKGKEVHDWHGSPSLVFMCSQTSVGTKPDWKIMETNYSVDWNNSCTVTFEVNHFTMFSVFWNILDVALPEHLKLHASSHVPHFSFWAYFQAFMTDCGKNKQFGLCVMCHRLGNDNVHGLQQYPNEVGCCKPRKVKSGKLEVKLKSGMFEGDQSVGESQELTKVMDFVGHDFDVHFACIFNTNSVPEIGLFGKVEITSLLDDTEEEFSFNLIKSNQSAGNSMTKRIPSEWESKVTKELAGMLSIDDHMWRELALSLGYNRVEIQTKFSGQLEPIHEMLADFMGRGGSPDEFTSSMYKVARMFKLVPLDEMKENQENRRLEAMQERRQQSTREMPGPSGFCVHANTSSDSSKLEKRKSDALYSMEPLSESKFDDIAAEISKSWKSIGRKLDVSEPELREVELNYQHAGEKEKAFQMLMAWRERDPENCVTSALYTVLHNSGLKYTAKKCLQ